MERMLDHITDVAVRVEGSTLAELFANGLQEMNRILSPETCGDPRQADCCMELELNAPDPTALLVDFLSECLALTYIHKALFCYVHFPQLETTTVRARLYGHWFDRLENEIKAVTFHEAEVRQNREGKWETPLLFDL
ncbi:MAG TPA: archease [Robiginitalea sp.]|nr:archease [Robiginitalea sp.]